MRPIHEFEQPPSGTLFVIEAPGKREALLATLRKMQIPGEVFSTGGHLLGNPDSLWPLYIDASFKELKRRPINEQVCKELRQLASKYERVVIATDPDDEGHVIANDVADLIGSHQSVLRGMFYGFDRKGIEDGMASIAPIERIRAVPGTARRVIDRWIGSTFSDPQKGISVGRVLSGALALIRRKPVTLGYVSLQLPSTDGGPPFQAKLPINHTNEHLIKQRLTEIAHRPALAPAERSVDIADKPMDLVDTVLRVSRQTGESIQVVEARLQRLYEKQHISYHRTDARSYNPKTVETVKALAATNRISINPASLPINDKQHAHESIHLLNTRIDLSSGTHFGDDQQTLLIIGKNMIESAQPQVRITADASSLPVWARDLTWSRTVSMNNGWHKDPEPEHGEVVRYTNEQALLGFLRDNGLGRPGTLVSHTLRLLDRDLLDKNLRLSSKGSLFLRHAPLALTEMVNHDRLEQAGSIDAILDGANMFTEGESRPPRSEDDPLPEISSSDVALRIKEALAETGLIKESIERRGRGNARPAIGLAAIKGGNNSGQRTIQQEDNQSPDMTPGGFKG